MQKLFAFSLFAIFAASIFSTFPPQTVFALPTTITITSPSDGAVLGDDLVTVTGTASDPAGIQKVEVSVDGGAFSLATGTTSWSFTTGVLTSGSHTIVAKATSNAGVVGITSVAVGNGPQPVAVNPTTNTIYVASYFSRTVTVINGATNTVTATIPVGFNPQQIAINPNTNTMYVVSFEGSSIHVVNMATNTVTTVIPLSSNGLGVAVNPTTNTVYASRYFNNDVVVINGATNTITATISGVNSPSKIAANPSTNTIYVSNQNTASVTVINGATNTIAATIPLPVGSSPAYVAVNPTTNIIYVTNGNPNDSISVINGATNTVTSIIPAGIQPNGVAVNPSTNTIYVSNIISDSVSVINGATNTVTAIIPVGDNPSSVAVNPTTNTIYTADSTSNTVTVINGATIIPVNTALTSVSFTITPPVTETTSITSGNGRFFETDRSVRMLVGPQDTGFNVALTPAQFAAARSGPAAYVIPNHPAWISGLSGSSAHWISTHPIHPNSHPDIGKTLSTALYAVDFEVGVQTISSASLKIRYATDNQLGDSANEGLFINGIPLRGSQDLVTGFNREGAFKSDISSLLQGCATNTLYVLGTDVGGPSGAIFDASIFVKGSGTCTTDTTAPVVTVSSETVEATGPGGASVSFTATAEDDVDGTLTPSCDATSGSTFAIGTTTVTCTATDAAGNTGTGTGTITVQDTTAPVITLVGANPATAECSASYADEGSTAFDIVNLDLTASIATGGLPVDTSAVGSGTVTYDVSDAAGNAADQVTRTVNVEDTTAPSATAALVPFGSGGDDDDEDEGKFIVQISGSDTCDASPAVTATLNGIAVTNGQPVKLEVDDETESKFKEAKQKQCAKDQKEADKRTAKGKSIGDELAWKLLVCRAGGELQMEGVSFTLTATATDASGNSSSVTASPTFAADEDDDD